MSRKIGILGAGGFLGSRLVERAFLSGDRRVVPILRYPRGLARLSRLAAPWIQIGGKGRSALELAIDGCDVVVNVTMGGESTILSDTIEMVEACRAAGVRRFIHMSSAAVYGQVGAPNLDDDAPPDLSLWMEYAREKGRAENYLRQEMDRGGLEIVVLRPGMIWGPGSIWLSGPAGALCRSDAFLLNGGAGVCNLIHVDNLCRDLMAVADFPHDPSGFYHVADQENLSWSDYYGALAKELGLSTKSAHRIELVQWKDGLWERLAFIKDSEVAKAVKRRMSKELKMKIKRLGREYLARIAPPSEKAGVGPVVTKVMWWNQGTRHRLPTSKFERVFGLEGRTSFAVNVVRAGAWLRFAGYNPDPFTAPDFGREMR